MKENMIFDLNNGSLISGGTAIFNNGLAGKVQNVGIEVKRKEDSGPFSYSDFTVVFTDGSGSTLNNLFSYYKNNDQYDEKKNSDNQGYLLGRIQSIAQAILPSDYVYPDVAGKSCNEIVDILFRIINDNSKDKKVNVFVCYGTKAKPSIYLNARFFNFIESVDKTPSRLSATGNDMMERITADAPISGEAKATSGGW